MVIQQAASQQLLRLVVVFCGLALIPLWFLQQQAPARPRLALIGFLVWPLYVTAMRALTAAKSVTKEQNIFMTKTKNIRCYEQTLALEI
jgi:hypothetical protein